LREAVAREGVTEAVRFHGWLAHEAVQTVAAQCSVLTFPSIREFGGGVVLEAMALGLAPIVVDYAGPGELVSDEVGFKTPIGSRAAVVAGLRERIGVALDRRAELPAIGNRARDLVRDAYVWPRKAERIVALYRRVIASGETAGAAAGGPAP
jgi:glycosyltransferase involved in cell wall biosynthesis